MNGFGRWVGVHAPAPLVVAWALACAAELSLGSFPTLLPWAPEIDLRWGLLLPMLTIATVVSMMHSGLAAFERSTARRWRPARAGWCLLLTAFALLPALGTQDGLALDGSLRNRLVCLALAVLASLVMPATLAVLPSTILMLVAMLLAGAADAGARTGPAHLLEPRATPLHWAVAVGVWLLAVGAYAVAYPRRPSEPTRGESA